MTDIQIQEKLLEMYLNGEITFDQWLKRSLQIWLWKGGQTRCKKK